MKPPFPYYGGKTRLGSWISGSLPEHEIYVEPYAGSLAVLFAKPRARHEIVNDLDDGLVTFFRVLRDRPEDLIRACRLTPCSRSEHEMVVSSMPWEGLDDVEHARRFWVRVQQSFNRQGSGSGWVFSTSQSKDRAQYQVALVARMEACAERLRGVAIEHGSAVDVIRRYGDRRAVMYLDPPYVHATRSSLGHRRSDYSFEMTDDAHRELAAVLNESPATIVLSGYDSDLYRELYAGWFQTVRSAPVYAGTWNGKARSAVEVLWSNRPLSARLFEH